MVRFDERSRAFCLIDLVLCNAAAADAAAAATGLNASCTSASSLYFMLSFIIISRVCRFKIDLVCCCIYVRFENEN